MQENTHSGLYKPTVYFIPSAYVDDTSPATLVLSTLSYRQLLDLNQFVYSKQYTLMYYHIVETCLVDMKNIITDYGDGLVPVDQPNIEYLSPSDIKETAEYLVTYSKVPTDFLETLEIGVDLSLDPKYKTNTWECTECQRRKLDKTRNCGFLNEQEKDPDWEVSVRGKVYKHCPIYMVDASLTSDAFIAYQYFKDGLLPESGGIYDQTEFFVQSSQFVSNKVAEYEQEEMKKTSKRT